MVGVLVLDVDIEYIFHSSIKKENRMAKNSGVPYMVKTEDGYTFKPLGGGEWGDEDGGWCNYMEMINCLKEQELKYKVYHILI